VLTFWLNDAHVPFAVLLLLLQMLVWSLQARKAMCLEHKTQGSALMGCSVVAAKQSVLEVVTA
jgi:hypothetical protein